MAKIRAMRKHHHKKEHNKSHKRIKKHHKHGSRVESAL